MKEMKPIDLKCVFFVGATASGKSAAALAAAEIFGAEIINADSIQMYKHVDIGSAKPSADEFQRRPHFLFDFVEAPHVITAGEFNRLFFEHMQSVIKRGAVPHPHPQFVVGGTGFYFQAIEKGLLPIPKTNPELQARLAETLKIPGGEDALYADLKERDPQAAARIHPRDHYRLLRALDICHSTGRAMSEILKEHQDSGPPFPYPLLKIGLRLEKEDLLQRVRSRTQQMLKRGLLDEVKALKDRGLEGWEPLGSVGYRESLQYLRGEIASPHELEELIVRETMRLAKKQRTWFSRDPQITWFHPQQQVALEAHVRAFLGFS